MKKIYLGLAIVLLGSSCALHNDFSRRKYTDFSSGKQHPVTQTRQDINELSFRAEQSRKTLAMYLPVDFKPNAITVKTSLQNTSFSAVLRPCTKVYRISTKSIAGNSFPTPVKFYKRTDIQAASPEHSPGSWWWVWVIVAGVGLITLLFLSAYLGATLLIAGLVFALLALLKKTKS